jgi:uncharacterized protein YndB with AHSA1/START domain
MDGRSMDGHSMDGHSMDGRLEKVGDRWQLRFTRRLPHPPEQVWRALTEPEHLAAWFPTAIEGDRRVGAPLRFPFPNGEGPTMDGEMVVYDPPSVLEFRWGGDTLRFEVVPDDDGSVLTMVDDFDELGRAARDGAGWHVCLDTLGEHLSGAAVIDLDGRWKPVHDGYVKLFGPEASTIGPPESYTKSESG